MRATNNNRKQISYRSNPARTATLCSSWLVAGDERATAGPWATRGPAGAGREQRRPGVGGFGLGQPESR